jgi:hypothetical protein
MALKASICAAIFVTSRPLSRPKRVTLQSGIDTASV